MLRSLTPSLGVIALLTTSGSFALNIIYAVELSPTRNTQRIPAFVASALLLIDLGALSLSNFRNAGKCPENEKMGPERKASFMFLTALAVAWFLAVAMSLGTLIWMQICLKDLPEHILGHLTRSMLVIAFALCGAFTFFQGIYIALLGAQARRKTFQSSPYISDLGRSVVMQEPQRPRPALGRYSNSITPSPPATPHNDRKRPNSDTFSSMRSSLSNSIRPMTSKTRLLSRLPSNKSNRSTRSSYKEFRQVPPAIDTNLSTIPSYTGLQGDFDSPVAVYDGFDTWDTSAVSLDSRQTISDSSPQSPFSSQLSPKPNTMTLSPLSVSLPPPLPTLSHSHSRTFLPTIPASPVVSRTPSPAFALDPPFKLISQRSRHRSSSPANSFHSTASNRKQNTLVAPPVILDPAEAHIHPLFRSDSPTPAPAVSTPGTSVTAAPNAGQMISESDRASLRRMRSDSLVSSPRLDSFDSVTEKEIKKQLAQQQLLDGANRKLQIQMERERGRASSRRTEERDSTMSEGTEGGLESEKDSVESEGDQDSKTGTSIPEWILRGEARNSTYKKRVLGSRVEESH